MSILENPNSNNGALRKRVAKLREDLTQATEAYRQAAARHDSAQAIPLLKFRSQLMRQLLETQCELLLSFRAEGPELAEAPVLTGESHAVAPVWVARRIKLSTFRSPWLTSRLRMVGVKLEERILHDFKIGVFIGLRKSNPGLHTAFFINGKHTDRPDLEAFVSGLKLIPAQVRKAYKAIAASEDKNKKRKRRKKDAK